MDGKTCPHVVQSVKFLGRKPNSLLRNSVKRKSCAVCEMTEWPLICLYCGVVYCGRYGNQHAIKHWESNPDHCINLNCQTYEVFCYNCDSDILNDTAACHIERLIQYIQQCYDNGDGQISDSGLSSSDRSSIVNGELLATSSMTHAQSSSNESSLQTQPTVRTLRPRSNRNKSSRQSNENEDQESSTNSRKESLRRRRSRNDSTCSSGSNNSKVNKKVVGLKNLGNTCFMNAVLQSLSNIQEFSHFFKQLPAITEQLSRKPNGRSGGGRGGVGVSSTSSSSYYAQRSLKDLNNHLMVEELRKVLICLTDHHLADNKSAISPDELFVVIWRVVPRFRSDVWHVGTTEYKKVDPFLDLSLDIPDIISKKRNKDGEEKPLCHLSECLKSFVEVEELAETEKYNCNNCKSKQRSTKRFWFKRLPNVLCIHLKRFRWTNACRTKVDTMIEFPVSSLDMSSYILPSSDTKPSDPQTGERSPQPQLISQQQKKDEEQEQRNHIYDLAAIIVHHGTGAGSGHYTAYAIHECQWWHFDDSTVIPVDVPALKKCKPYILFYVRRVPNVKKED
uniref:Ubiquitin carboxyl-terminal hydrolase n=1 Tax=Cacopsylla melanoneura TaxID=428564 RepID=A0A8D8U1Y6_9HEMI